jgi:hypothetical protein
MGEWRYNSTIHDLGTGWISVVRLTPRSILQGGKSSVPLVMILVEAWTRLDSQVENIFLRGRESEPPLSSPYSVIMPADGSSRTRMWWSGLNLRTRVWWSGLNLTESWMWKTPENPLNVLFSLSSLTNSAFCRWLFNMNFLLKQDKGFLPDLVLVLSDSCGPGTHLALLCIKPQRNSFLSS